MLIRLLVLFMVFPAYATVFQKQPVEQQIRESDGIVIGHYLRSKSVKLDDGTVATQMIFKMNKELGMQSELFGMDEIIVHYPGGTDGDRIVKVDGVPEFVSGENVVLMIKGHQDRYWGMNLGFGTFKVISYGNEKLIVNTVFPEDRNVGQMKLEDFERTVKIIKGSGLKTVAAPVFPSEEDRNRSRAPASMSEGKNRAIASKTDEQENKEAQGMNTMWLVLILAAMGGIFRLMRQRELK